MSNTNNISLSDRMKDYEVRQRSYLPRRSAAVIRIDGKAFHSYTKGLQKPFDTDLFDAMAETAKYLCENIQGAKIAYMQSDEISVLVTDYDDIRTDAWFDYQVEKMVSVASSLATTKFLHERVKQLLEKSSEIGFVSAMDRIQKMKLPAFDARVFSLPCPEEVVNYFLWRQQDAERNSIQALAQAHFSHKELHKKNTSQMQDMLHTKGINWNDCHTRQKRGITIVRAELPRLVEGKASDKKFADSDVKDAIRRSWVIDNEMPIVSKDRTYIKRLLP